MKILNINLDTIDLDISSNNNLNSYTGTTFSLIYTPSITYNKGINYKVIRKDSTLIFSDKYLITKNNI